MCSNLRPDSQHGSAEGMRDDRHEQIRPYLESLARQRDVPLARTLTWKYHYTLGSGKHAQSWFVPYLMYAFGSGPDPRPRSSTSAGTC